MLFGLEADYGDQIIFYLVPNAYSVVPKARILVDSTEIMVLSANETRQSLVSAGRHETGQCGFRIDASVLPGLADLNDVSIYDCETGLLIYKRLMPENVSRKVLRLETSFLPMSSLDNMVVERFQYYQRSIEKHGHETVSQLFVLANINSVYLSGRILYRNYSVYVDGTFDVAIFIEDPYTNLAGRLLVLARLLKNDKMYLLGERDALLYKPAAEFASSLQIGDGRLLRRAMRNLPQEVAVALVNPLVRQLTSTAPDEMPRRGALAGAFDALSSFSMVGIRDADDQFYKGMTGLLGFSVDNATTIPLPPNVVKFAQLLREEAQVEEIIDHDLAIYDQLMKVI